MAGVADPFNPRLIAAVVAGGVVAFVAFVLLAAYAPDFRSGRDPRAHALSPGGTGFQGLVRLIGHAGGEARTVRFWDEVDTEDLMVLTVEDRSDPDLLAELVEARDQRPTLIVLPKWDTLPHDARPGWVRVAGLIEAQEVAWLVHSVAGVKVRRIDGPPGGAVVDDFPAALDLPLPATAQTLTGEGVTPLISAPGGGAVLAQVGHGSLYLLADPDLMNNHGIADPVRARAALTILDELNATGAQGVAFDLHLAGFGRHRSPIRLLFEPPFLVLTLAIFAAAVLAGLHGAARFGQARPEGRDIAFGKAALVENSAGLMQLARREHRAGAAYADLVRDAAARAAGAPPGLAGEALDAYLDRLSPPDAPRFSELAARAAAAGDRHQLVGAAQALFQWKKELIR